MAVVDPRHGVSGVGVVPGRRAGALAERLAGCVLDLGLPLATSRPGRRRLQVVGPWHTVVFVFRRRVDVPGEMVHDREDGEGDVGSAQATARLTAGAGSAVVCPVGRCSYRAR